MQRDLALIFSVLALCAVTLVGALLYKHTADSTIHCSPNGCPTCPCDPPRKSDPYKPRRPGGSTGEVGKDIDQGVKVRDM